MTTSNRLLNRLVLLAVGLGLIAVAGGAVVLAGDGAIAAPLRASAAEIAATIASRLSPPAGSAGDVATTWPLWSVALIAVAVVVAAFVFAASHGRGRTSTMVRHEHLTDEEHTMHAGHATSYRDGEPTGDGRSGGSRRPDDGAIEVATGFAQTALADALGRRPEIASVHVSAYRRRAETAVKIRVLPRAGVSPRAVVEVTRDAVLSLDQVLGARVPVVLEIAGSGARARTASDSWVG